MSRFSSRPSSGRPSPPARRRQSDETFLTDCKAAYLITFEDLSDEITSKQQLQTVLQQAGRNPSRRVLEKYWTRDTDSLLFHDFVEICRKEQTTSENDLMKAFHKIDINGDGYITNSELMRVMTTKGEKMSKQEVQDLIDEVDENNDGKLDYKEFCKMLMSTTEEIKNLGRKKLEKHVASHGSKDRPLSARSNKSTDSYQRLARSQAKNDVDDDNDDVVIGSQVSLKTASSASMYKDVPKPSPRPRGDASKSPAPSRKVKVTEPRDIKSWDLVHWRGSFFVEEDGSVVSHQYTLTLTEDTSVWITMEPYCPRGQDSLSVDTMLYILREKSDHNGNYLVTFTEQKDSRGRFCVRADLQRGKYTLAPFTSGCKLKKRASQPKPEAKLVRKDKDENKFILTKQFREVLGEVFDLCDLDGNGLLNRNEFNLFNLRTSGEEVADEEWEVVEENVELKKGQITKKGFMDLNQMEADDNEGDTDDLWVTLSSMGYNKALLQDEGASFTLNVYAEEKDSMQLRVKGVESGGDKLQDAVCQSVTSKGEALRIKGMKDLYMYTYRSDVRACVVVENKSRSRLVLEFDCSKSRNVISNRPSLDFSLEVPARSTVVGIHVFPANPRHEWSFHCADPVVK